MAEYFSFKGKDECGTTRYIDIPHSQCVNGTKLVAWHCFHGGVNQQWRWEEGRIVSSMSPRFCLAAEMLTDGAVVFLSYTDERREASSAKKDLWTCEAGVIKLQGYEDFYLGLVNEKLLLRKKCSTGDTTKWEMEVIEPKVKPATSCHLQYEPIPTEGLSESWTLENSVRVKNSADCTYFCVVGFGPGGYCGIQQINKNHKAAIFSMWNDNQHAVAEMERGDAVTIRSFGGEGKGMKAMKSLQWKNEENIRFRVRGKSEVSGGVVVWRCSCWYRIEDGEWIFMAAFERPGNAPFNNHFYSFVEDWNRSDNSEGHVHQRSGEFFDAQVITGDGETHHLSDVIFTKQTDGADKFGCDKVVCGVNTRKRCFVLSTGGDSNKYIKDYLEKDGCNQTVTGALAKLKL